MSAKQFLNGHLSDPGYALINLGDAMVCDIPEFTTLARGETRIVGAFRKIIARGFLNLCDFTPWTLAPLLAALFAMNSAVVMNNIPYNP
jgi:branched-subunit amino acid ABC-type transport system permease component